MDGVKISKWIIVPISLAAFGLIALFAIILFRWQQQSQQPPPATGHNFFTINPDGSATLEGQVVENDKGCAYDAMCFLVIQAGDISVHILYGAGEQAPGTGPAICVLPDAAIASGGDSVQASGRYASRNGLITLTPCGRSSDYFRLITGLPLAKKRVCPDQWIENRMPGLQPVSQYFIINGKRVAVEQYDIEWIKANCSVDQPQAVY